MLRNTCSLLNKNRLVNRLARMISNLIILGKIQQALLTFMTLM